MAKKMDYDVRTGSAKPVAPQGTPGKAVGGHGPGSYNPGAAASHLKELGTDYCAPDNNGPMHPPGNPNSGRHGY